MRPADTGAGPDPATTERFAAEAATRVLAAPPRLGSVRLLAVDGPSGAGKTRLAAEIGDVLRARGVETAQVSTDDFATWDEPVSWWPRLAAGVLEPLAEGRPGRYRRTEWSAHGQPYPGSWVDVPAADVLVLEGVSSGRRSVRGVVSVLCWLDHGDEAARLERAVGRDGEWSRPHLRAWQRFEAGWFAVDEPWKAAHLRYSAEWTNH